MFELAKTNQEIGGYLSELIAEKFKSQREFCKEYIKIFEKREADEVEVQNMANRLCQIKNGAKSLQLYDLPIFSKLLEVSCEEMLSAEKYFAPVKNRMTNYVAAFVKDKNLWEEYRNREDKLILNYDEYGKTVIDYAFEFKNFEFLKYLMENKFIQFVNNDERYYSLNFAAKTNIKPREFHAMDTGLQNSFYKEGEELRAQMITLAIENKESTKMLDELRAREIPALYRLSQVYNRETNFNEYYDENLLEQISEANDEVLDYFSEEFEIQTWRNVKGKKDSFMFPYLSSLIDLLIKSKNKHLEIILRRAIEHNQKVYDKIKKLMGILVEWHEGQYKQFFENNPLGFIADANSDQFMKNHKDKMIEGIMRDFGFLDDGDIVNFSEAVTAKRDGIVSNIVHTHEKSNDDKIIPLIKQLNNLYRDIRNIKPSAATYSK
jgi:hypothetical protein